MKTPTELRELIESWRSTQPNVMGTYQQAFLDAADELEDTLGTMLESQEKDAQDARRCRWLVDRIEIRRQPTAAGTYREFFEFMIGCNCVGSSHVRAWTDQKYADAAKAKVQAAIDAALASEGKEGK